MAEPRVVPRAEHAISRRDIDPDALKVLYRLRQSDYIAYLVGGSVRDLLLGRRPKDFDLGTSAHPHQVKKLFRNCWIIGRRFRLCHVRFGPKKVIEVATFRRMVQPGEDAAPDGAPPEPAAGSSTSADNTSNADNANAHIIHRDNTFGTPEEDAFRRDFTINALFYDIATFSVIDYVNGLEDLRAGIIRSIGDPHVRFKEDPVRMLRAVAFASRLNFRLDPPVRDAIRLLRHEITNSAPPRLLEEYYKILRGGYAEKTFRALDEAGLLEAISPELHAGAGDRLWQSLAAIDAYRARFEAAPDAFTNTVLLGSLLVPLGLTAQPLRHSGTAATGVPAAGRPPRAPGPRLGELPLARRDVERLHQILGLQRRLHDALAHPRTRHAVVRRGIFADALTWLEIHGREPALVEQWKAALVEIGNEPAVAGGPGEGEAASGNVAEGQPPFKRKRRRRRRGRRSAPKGNV
jgi:poly(A) polymerase